MTRADGSRLTLPQPELLPSRQIKVGDIATFTYEYHARIDTPINPQITRIRQDLTWRDVLRDHVMHEVSANEELGTTCPLRLPLPLFPIQFSDVLLTILQLLRRRHQSLLVSGCIRSGRI